MDNISKSNRAQADYFELLVCRYVCLLHNVTFNYARELEEQKEKVLIKSDGIARLRIQDNNFVKAQPEIKKILDNEIVQKGAITNVIWIGRNLSDGTTSDVDIKHINNQLTRFSIKSIATGGTGTLKNLGARNIKKYMNVDFSTDYEKMWQELRTYINDFSSSQEKIKKMVQTNRNLLCWATENGKKYQSALNKICFNNFNLLPLKEKIVFLNFITDCNDENLYVIIVNSLNVITYKPVDVNLNYIKTIEVRDDNKTESGYTIFVDNKPTYRVQTNNTNGIGISAYCQRIFWI